MYSFAYQFKHGTGTAMEPTLDFNEQMQPILLRRWWSSQVHGASFTVITVFCISFHLVASCPSP